MKNGKKVLVAEFTVRLCGGAVMKKKIVLEYSPNYDKPYSVIKAYNTVDWVIGQRLSEVDVRAIVDRRPPVVEVEIVKGK